MKVYICDDLITVREAPVGLFLIEDSGEVICISEYSTNSKRDAYIVSSGENYCGQGDEALGRSLVLR